MHEEIALLAGAQASECGTYFYHRARLTFAHGERAISFIPKGREEDFRTG